MQIGSSLICEFVFFSMRLSLTQFQRERIQESSGTLRFSIRCCITEIWSEEETTEQRKSGLISKAVKTYFDRKAVKTRLKPVKNGLNRSKRGQNLKLRKMCQGLWKNPVRWIYICPSMLWLVYLDCWEFSMCKKIKCRPFIWTSVKMKCLKALMHFNTKCHHSINAHTVTWFI